MWYTIFCQLVRLFLYGWWFADPLVMSRRERKQHEFVDHCRTKKWTNERERVALSISRISLEFIIPRSRQPSLSRRRVDQKDQWTDHCWSVTYWFFCDLLHATERRRHCVSFSKHLDKLVYLLVYCSYSVGCFSKASKYKFPVDFSERFLTFSVTWAIYNPSTFDFNVSVNFQVSQTQIYPIL